MSLYSPKDFPATYATTQFRRKFSPGATEKSLATLARAHFITTTNSTDRGVTGCGARPNSTNRRGGHVAQPICWLRLQSDPTFPSNTPRKHPPGGFVFPNKPHAKNPPHTIQGPCRRR